MLFILDFLRFTASYYRTSQFPTDIFPSFTLIVGGMKGCIEEGRKERGRESGKTLYLKSTYQGQAMVIVDASS